MRVTRFYLTTLKEAPAEAEVVSQKLMLRTGMIEGVGRHLQLDAAGPSHAAQGRADRPRGDEPGGRNGGVPAARAARRAVGGDRALGQVRTAASEDPRPPRARLLFGPTHEEIITDVVRKDIKATASSVNLLIQVKFRDEIRPRFGVMRGREFLMKDAYRSTPTAMRSCGATRGCTTPTCAFSRASA